MQQCILQKSLKRKEDFFYAQTKFPPKLEWRLFRVGIDSGCEDNMHWKMLDFLESEDHKTYSNSTGKINCLS